MFAKKLMVRQAAALAFLLSGLVPATAGELETTEIHLSSGFDPIFAPQIVALTKGWFKEAGFTSIETPKFTSGALAGEALAAGEVDLWTPGNVPPISMHHNGMPIVVVGTNATAYIEKFVVRSDAKLEKPEDLLNLRIGLMQGSTASVVMNNIAAQYGVDATALQIVNLPPPEQLTSITRGDIQAFVVWNPWPYVAMRDENVDVEILHTGTVGNFAWDKGAEFQTSYTRSLWVMSEEFITKNPNTANAMMSVLYRAQDYAADPANHDEVIQMVADFLDQPTEQIESLWSDYGFENVFDDSYTSDMVTYTKALNDFGRIDGNDDPLSYTFTGFTAEHNPDLVSITGTWQP